MESMDKEIYLNIDSKADEAIEYYLEGKRAKAIATYLDALDLIPEPKTMWEESWTFYWGISELFFQSENFSKALEYLKICVRCPNGLGNPKVHLRLGQINFLMGNFEQSKDELMRAYMGGGEEIFANEDKKYFAFILPDINRPFSKGKNKEHD